MDLRAIAMESARSLGADYADIRIQKTRTERIVLQNESFKDTSNNVLHGYGIRVLKNGAWGFAHSGLFEREEVLRTVKKALEIAKHSASVKKGKGIVLAPERSYIDCYYSPMRIDPFCIPLQEKTGLMLEANRILLNYPEIKSAVFVMQIRNDFKLFGNTEGSLLDMDTTMMYLSLTANAVTEEDSQSRTFTTHGQAAGWELVESANILERAPVIAQEAIWKTRADSLGDERRMSLILDPANLGLTMHESVGHPTELDRILGWEADFAGTSFVDPSMVGGYRYGSEIVNFLGDNTLPVGLATAGYDDDGVPGQKWYIVKDGILNDLGTTRETAPFIGARHSRGCSRATHYFDFPINRIPNLYLEAGKKPLTPQELIADTEDGVMIEGMGSFSIDQHRCNFQFGGDMFWEIKNGKKTRMLKKILYKSNNPEFWNSCDAICDQRWWRPIGVPNCGKGQPMQASRMTHGAAPARFRNIRVGGSQ